MRYLVLALAAAAALSGCSWETYRNENGHTALRQKYEKGTRVYYQDGTYSRNMNYNQYRPEQRTIKPLKEEEKEHEVRGTTWQKIKPKS